MAGANRRHWQTLASHMLVYLLWFGLLALSGLGLFVMRSAISQWYVVLPLAPNAHKAVDRLYLFVAGVVWVFLIFYLEGYLRQGIGRNDLGRRTLHAYGWTALYLLSGALLLAGLELFVWLFS